MQGNTIQYKLRMEKPNIGDCATQSASQHVAFKTLHWDIGKQHIMQPMANNAMQLKSS